ncbi:MAG: hypothetical protein K5910_00130 [Bacteroidales bacterium]|nr:hypothetical protein [Bacteroidales bacterium]
MKKALRISGIVVAALLGLVLLVLVALPLVLNSKAVTNLVDRYAAEYIDGDLEYSRLRIALYRDLPRVGITLEDVAVTYPHGRFSAYDTLPAPSPLLDAGRGAVKDTLARFASLTVSADALKLIRDREFQIEKVALERPAIYAHDYGGEANWDIIRLPEQKDTAQKAFDLPWIHLRELRIGGWPHLVYTSREDALCADLRFRQLTLEGKAKIASEGFRLGDVRLAMDSLHVFGHHPGDTVDASLHFLRADQRAEREFDLALAADALLNTAAYGKMDVPLRAEGTVNYELQPGRTTLGIPRLDARLAHVPLHAEGSAVLQSGQVGLDAVARISDCPVDSLQRSYLDRFVPISRQIRTNARLDLDLKADGTYSKTSIPRLTARVRVPASNAYYTKMRLGGTLALDIDAEMSPDKRIDGRIRTLRAKIPGAQARLDGTVHDLLGRDPRYKLKAQADASLGPLLAYVPESLGIEEASGDVHVDLAANVSQSELNRYHFQKADISGTLTSDSIHVSIPKDSIDALLYQPNLLVGSNQAGIRLNADFDSLYFNRGVNLQARIRQMRNGAQIIKVPVEGQMVPRLYASTDNGDIFAKIGSSRMGVSGSSIWLSAEKRVRPAGERRYRTPVRRVSDFADRDITIALDTSYSRLLREWAPSGSVVADSGFFASPRLPLRTRLTTLSAEFNDNEIDIDSVGVVSGSSDARAAGYLQGIRQALLRHGVLEAQLNVESGRLNINEFVAALQAGSQDVGAVDPVDERDESFVTDTLEDARIDKEKMRLVVVPGNVKATLGVQADTVDYAELQVGPVLAVARLQDNTAQLLGTHVISDIGSIGLDGYYSTRSKEDIAAGVNLRLSDMKAHDIIQLLPSVDSLIPALKSFEGRLDCDIAATTQLDTNMNVVIPSLDGLMRITGKDLEVKDAGDLRRITRLLLFRNKNIGHINDLYVDAVVHDSKLEVFPFELGVDRYKLALRGTQGFDKSMYYHISILRSPFLLRFGINLFGSLDNWKFQLGRARYREGHVPVYTRQLDSVQVNIAQGIRDIFNSGIRRVQAFNEMQESEHLSEDDSLSVEERLQVEELIVEAELEEQQELLDEEVNAALEAASQDTERLIQEYTEEAYDKRILRQMERMKKDRE